MKNVAKKKKQQQRDGEAATTALICVRCGVEFDAAEQEKKDYKDYSRSSKGEVRCSSLKKCRRRVLDAQAAGRGVLDLYSKHWRDTLIQRADPKPSKPPSHAPAEVLRKWEEWESPLPPDDRVIAAIELFSWCWPANTEFAVQLDDNEDHPLVDRRSGQYVHHTHASLAAWLGMDRANFVRTVRRWERRKRLRHDEDGRMYLVEHPDLTDEDRTDLRKRNEWSDLDFGDLKIPPQYEKPLSDFLLDLADGEAESIAVEKAKAIRLKFNRDLKEIRQQQDTAFNDLLKDLAAKAGRTWEPEKRKKRSAEEAAGISAPPAASSENELPAPDFVYPEPTPAEARAAEFAALHAAGHGKGALAALPRPRPVLVDRWPLTAEELEQQGWLIDDRGIELFVQPCREVRRDCTDAELATAVRMKARFARAKDFPLAYLRTLVIGLLQEDRTYRGVQRDLARYLSDRKRLDPAAEAAAIEDSRRNIQMADRHQRYCEARANNHLANMPAEDLEAQRAALRQNVKKSWGHLPAPTIEELTERQLVRATVATLGLPALAEFAERPEYYEGAEFAAGAGGDD